MKLNAIQEQAVNMALRNDFIFSITGGAGTGKSTVIKSVLERAERVNGRKYQVLAPTGKAVQRLKEFTNGSTIHSFLEFFTQDFGETYKPKYGRGLMFPEPKHLIIDEASMLTVDLFATLLKALPTGSTVCLVGDNNQLPPIEPEGTKPTFEHCLKKYPSINLEIRYRFGNQIHLSDLSDRVLNGEFQKVMQSPMAYRLDGVTDAAQIARMCKTDKYYLLDNQIISPTYKGVCGCDRINSLCQSFRVSTNSKAQRLHDDFNFYYDDKVIFTRNGDGFFNGGIGYIKAITDKYISVHTGDEMSIISRRSIINKKIEVDNMNAISLAYAITTHKSQGSEYENVVYILGKGCYSLANKANIYTGITRSKKNLVFLYDYSLLRKGLSDDLNV